MPQHPQRLIFGHVEIRSYGGGYGGLGPVPRPGSTHGSAGPPLAPSRLATSKRSRSFPLVLTRCDVRGHHPPASSYLFDTRLGCPPPLGGAGFSVPCRRPSRREQPRAQRYSTSDDIQSRLPPVASSSATCLRYNANGPFANPYCHGDISTTTCGPLQSHSPI